MTDNTDTLRTAHITFSYPLHFGEQTWPEVTMTEPLVSDQLAVDEAGQTNGQFEARLIARQCGLPFEAVRQMRTCDYNKLSTAFKTFLSGPASK
ncbi:MAG: phage tail assembly protein [Desulfovibrionaceae bacterium]